MAHRFFWEQAKGPVPDGLVLDHLCGNRACVNPEHLEVVTRGVNTRRGRRTKLTEPQVRVIRTIVSELASSYGVSIRTICNVAECRSWRHVD
ncbi:MAG: HNH endonuclease [Thermoleophilaceae bacterium]